MLYHQESYLKRPLAQAAYKNKFYNDIGANQEINIIAKRYSGRHWLLCINTFRPAFWILLAHQYEYSFYSDFNLAHHA